MPTYKVGLHAFRHGLATELVENCVPMTVLQAQMRHADVQTTLRIYSHAVPATLGEAMDRLSIGTNVPIGTNSEGQAIQN